MKKAVAALLSMFVGLFGYEIVDKALEERVSNLESVVSSQQELIESYHGETAATTVPTSIEKETTEKKDSSTAQNDTTESEITTWTVDGTTKCYDAPYVGYSLNTDHCKKMMYRLYSSGTVCRISPEYLNGDSSLPYAETNVTEVGDYFAYIDEVSAVITSIEEITDVSTSYNYDYELCSETIDMSNMYITVKYKGHTDPVFAGREISTYINFDLEKYSDGFHGASTIASDGSFEFTGIHLVDKQGAYAHRTSCYINLLDIT